MNFVEGFLDRWNRQELNALIEMTAPTVHWDDVSGCISFDGHEGVKQMFDITFSVVPDCRFSHDGGFQLGKQYCVEWTMHGTAFGQQFSCKGASVGVLDDQGRILENRDYWNTRTFPGMPATADNPVTLADVKADANA